MSQVKGTRLPPKAKMGTPEFYTEKKCRKCGATLKFNLIRKKPHADTCYKCHKEDK